jgi:hypothetical protein
MKLWHWRLRRGINEVKGIGSDISTVPFERGLEEDRAAVCRIEILYRPRRCLSNSS